ncbi:MAG: hypothetical protein M1823_003753 [Watsoniomyces obsoletus]|nr:MAG: hypothetical protein M1823_003753 [Watsoniomyces obsoletus]
MASSANTRRTRTRTEESGLDESSDVPMPDVSPTRPTKRRRQTVTAIGNAAASNPEPTTPENKVDGPEVMLNAVIATLSTGTNEVNVAIHHGNSKLEQEFKNGVQAYAKIAGATWTYYVKTLRVNIGRPPDNSPATTTNDETSTALVSPPHSSPGVPGANDLVVHIDLGPSKFISRQHAIIEYAAGGLDGWQLIVNGRNGVKVNEQTLKRGGQTILQSGDILEIGGTQMMFVTPNDDPRIHPSFLVSSGLSASGGRLVNARSKVGASKAVVATRVARANSVPQRPSRAGSKTPSAIARALASPTPAHAPRQSTPGGAVLRTPQQADTKPKPSPSYNRGLVLETTQEIDYSLDSAKDIKPPYSYATMIGQAILASEEEKLTLNAIYQSIMDRYAFYRLSQTGWQNSIRHNLSLNKAFEKIPRRTDEPGKGMKWQIAPQHREEFTKRASRPSTRGGHRNSSTPNSPAAKEPTSGTMAPTSSGGVTGLGLALTDGPPMSSVNAAPANVSSGSVTPPRRGAYPVSATEAYTPDRGPRLSVAQQLEQAGHQLGDGSPLPPSRSRLSLHEPSAFSDDVAGHGSPLGGMASPAYLNDHRPLITPAPQRQELRLAPPSTAHLPSIYMPNSSPAPFWKYVNFDSTPARPLPDPSPIKAGGPALPEQHQPSSPPVVHTTRADLESPSKSGGLEMKAEGGRKRMLDDLDDDSDSSGPLEEVRGAIDLARGFEPIGSFHSKMTNAAV